MIIMYGMFTRIACNINLAKNILYGQSNLFIISLVNTQSNSEHFQLNSFRLGTIFPFNSLRPSDAYMRQQTNHHWFR